MRLPIAVTLALALHAASFVPRATAQVAPCPPNTASGVICMQGNLSGTLVSGQIYHVFTPSSVASGDTLTIQGGAIVKLSGAGSPLTVDGTLVIDPTAILTSIHDDATGGDTNGNGGQTTPAGNDWGGLRFRDGSDSSLIDGATIRYGGAGILCFQADITVTSTTIRDCANAAIDLQGTSFPTITSCILQGNGRAISDAPLGAVPLFNQNSASGNAAGDFVDVTDDAFGLTDPVITPTNLINGVLVVCTQITVPQGRTLTFSPGIVIKHDGCGPPVVQEYFVEGTLICTGVDFTSIHDDTFGGDTNANGNATVPAPGDWTGFRFRPTSDASVMTATTVRYAGAFGTTASIVCTDADVTLDGVCVRDGDRDALNLTNGSAPTVTACSFVDNAGIPADNVPLTSIPGFTNNTASGNAGGDFLRVDDGISGTSGIATIGAGPLTLSPANTMNQTGVVVSASSWRVAAGATLTLDEGLIVKWDVPATASSNLRVEVLGTLDGDGSAANPVVFTSIHDDTAGGDSNGNGSATSGQAGHWQGFTFAATSGNSSLRQAIVRHAGSSSSVLRLTNVTGVTFDTVDVEDADSAGIDCAGSEPVVTGCAFVDLTGIVARNVPLRAVPGFTAITAQNTGGDYLRVTNGIVGNAISIGPDNTVNQSGVVVVDDEIEINAGADVSLLDGTILKFVGSLHGIAATGTLTCSNIGPAGVTFTSFEDDAFGGDTNQDGTATAPAPGDWRALRFFPAAAGSVLDNVRVRHAGASNTASIHLSFSDVTIRNSTIERGASDGFDLNANSYPLLADNLIRECNLAIDEVPVAALPGFSGNSAALNAGDYVRVTDGDVPSGTSMILDGTMSVDGRPFVVRDDLRVLAGADLTISGGTLVKFDGDRDVTANGPLTVTGSGGPPAVFTSFFDDTVGGDTNNDGGATAPAPGDWGTVFVFDGSSLLQGLSVQYAGSNGAGVDCAFEDPQLLEVSIRDCLGTALDLSGSSRADVRGCSFDQCARPMVGVRLDGVQNLRNNTASGNAEGNALRIGNAALSGLATVERYNALNQDGVFTVNTSISVDASDTLRLGPGVIFKWRGGSKSLTVDGTCDLLGTGFDPVVFTHLNDDEIAGDTNNDGNATLPAPGSWTRVQFRPGSQGRIEHTRIRYAGAFNAASLFVDSSSVSMTALRADRGAADGVFISDLGGDATNLVAFENGGRGIRLNGGSFDLVHATVANNTGTGVSRSSSHVGIVANSISFGNGGVNYFNVPPGSLVNSNGDPAQAGTLGNLDVDPRFVDAVLGYLRLEPTSPCIDAADLAIGISILQDHVAASRFLDHDLDGSFGADMGAFELAAYAMEVGGRPELGTTMTFTVQGPVGVSVVAFGTQQATQALPPFGMLLVSDIPSLVILGVVPVGAPVVIPIPNAPTAAGFEFAIQGLGVPTANPAVGNLTSVFRGRLY